MSQNNTSSIVNQPLQNNKFNPWKLASAFQIAYPDLAYNLNLQRFYNYNEAKNLWETLTDLQVKNLILDWIIKAYPKDYTKFPPHNTSEIITLLQRKVLDINILKSKLHKDGFLLPFLNGVLNCKTLELKPHAKELYSTHIINVNYRSDVELKETQMAQFLTSLVGNNPYALNTLRACLYLILTNTLKYQVALYIYGPGGTGKTTFTNMLLYLFGTEASISTSLNLISSKFGTHLLRDKLLLIINELPLLLGSEPSIIKSITGGDSIMGEEKYKTATQFIPNLFLVITSNSLWNFKNATTAMSRRFIYINFNNKPVSRNSDLFNISAEGLAYGNLVEHLPALINWALTCPQEQFIDLREGGDKVTEKLNPNSQIITNPIKVWVLENLEFDANSRLPLGAHKKDEYTLYGNYLSWSNKHATEIGSIKSTQFSSLLIDTLSSLNWNVSKKRLNTGTVITGIKFRVVPLLTTELAGGDKMTLDFNIYNQKN